MQVPRIAMAASSKPNTRDNALSRLFGKEPSEETSSPEEEKASTKSRAEEEKASQEKPPLEALEAERSEVDMPEASATKVAGEVANPSVRTVAAPAREEQQEGNADVEGESVVVPHVEKQRRAAKTVTGYIGDGRYRQQSGEEKERITPYVRPDQARALKVAAATGDPRGKDISAIVRTLLDEAGLCDPDQRGT